MALSSVAHRPIRNHKVKVTKVGEISGQARMSPSALNPLNPAFSV
jgi:hypothetical protein